MKTIKNNWQLIIFLVVMGIGIFCNQKIIEIVCAIIAASFVSYWGFKILDASWKEIKKAKADLKALKEKYDSL
jgi:hypothetical protein